MPARPFPRTPRNGGFINKIFDQQQRTKLSFVRRDESLRRFTSVRRNVCIKMNRTSHYTASRSFSATPGDLVAHSDTVAEADDAHSWSRIAIKVARLTSNHADSSDVLDAAAELLHLTKATALLNKNRDDSVSIRRVHVSFLTIASLCIKHIFIQRGIDDDELADSDIYLNNKNNNNRNQLTLVNAAVELSHRALELQLPLHMPLFQQLMEAAAYLDTDVRLCLEIGQLASSSFAMPLERRSAVFESALVTYCRRASFSNAANLMLGMRQYFNIKKLSPATTIEILEILKTFLRKVLADTYPHTNSVQQDEREKELFDVMAMLEPSVSSIMKKELREYLRRDVSAIDVSERNDETYVLELMLETLEDLDEYSDGEDFVKDDPIDELSLPASTRIVGNSSLKIPPNNPLMDATQRACSNALSRLLRRPDQPQVDHNVADSRDIQIGELPTSENSSKRASDHIISIPISGSASMSISSSAQVQDGGHIYTKSILPPRPPEIDDDTSEQSLEELSTSSEESRMDDDDNSDDDDNWSVNSMGSDDQLYTRSVKDEHHFPDLHFQLCKRMKIKRPYYTIGFEVQLEELCKYDEELFDQLDPPTDHDDLDPDDDGEGDSY
jgi:hypothetical protein